ncbi:uncharacterized protein ASPGLDRAFT_112688, partial [Aspergillus glaucus CBS 516.65]
MFRPIRLSSRLSVLHPVRWNSTASPAMPPLMATFRQDLKDAMRAKNTPKLNVLRALISEVNNSVKTPSPIQTDLQLLSLIRKRVSGAQQAAKQFEEAGRADLKEGEDLAVSILEQYAGHVKTMGVDEIKSIVSQELNKLREAGGKADIGSLLKALFAPGGALDGKPAERSEVAKIAREAVAA